MQEALYHVVALLLYFAASVCFMVYLNKDDRHYVYNYGPKTAAAVSDDKRGQIWRGQTLRSLMYTCIVF